MRRMIFCLLLILIAETTSSTPHEDSTNIFKRSAEPTLGLLIRKKLAKKALLFGKRSVVEEDSTIVKRAADPEPTLGLLLQKKLAKKALLSGYRSIGKRDADYDGTITESWGLGDTKFPDLSPEAVQKEIEKHQQKITIYHSKQFADDLKLKLDLPSWPFGKCSVDEEDYAIVKRDADAEPTLGLLLRKKLAKKALLFG